MACFTYQQDKGRDDLCLSYLVDAERIKDLHNKCNYLALAIAECGLSPEKGGLPIQLRTGAENHNKLPSAIAIMLPKPFANVLKAVTVNRMVWMNSSMYTMYTRSCVCNPSSGKAI